MTRFALTLCAASLLASAVQAAPATYPTPQAAYEAFAVSLEQGDREAILDIFGPDAEETLFAEDPEENAENRETILALMRDGYRFRTDETGVTTLILGAVSWTFPIPLTETEGGWQFDVEAGREEILEREIGLNELDVIDLLEAYVDLQAAFRLRDHDGDGVMEYASEIIAEPGAFNGLFWPEEPDFVGQILARAALTGWSDGETDFEPEPFSGYYFTILHAQGEAAPGGAYAYMVGDNLVAGHAMLAVPSDYGVTGVHSFLVSENGIVLEADLGEDTLARIDDLTLYDPGEAWSPVVLEE